MGERVGGDNPCDPLGKRSFIRRAWDWLFGRRSHNRVTIGMPTSSVEPDLPTISQAPDTRTPSTIGGYLQAYRDSEPIQGYGAAQGGNIIAKGLIDNALDFGNFIRNAAFNKSDYSGLGARMTKWDGNTMSATESQDLKFNALLFADGLVTGAVGNTAKATASVYRATNNSLENQIVEETGYIMSDAARSAYIEASYSGMSQKSAINYALKASKQAHADNIAHFGSLKKYMDAHTLLGTEFNGIAPRSMISFSSDKSIISNFGKTAYKVSTNKIKKQNFGGESEVFIFHMIKVKK